MSTITATVSAKDVLKGTITQSSEFLIKDLKYIDDDKLNVSPMGCARAPLAFIAECAGLNFMVVGALKGEEPKMPSEEQRKEFVASINTRERATEAIKSSTTALLEALNNCSEETLMHEIMTPWGQLTPLHKMAAIAGSHMMYHDGQINYIQCLYGDDKFHWMED